MTRIEVREEAACWAHYWLTELYWLYEEITELKEGRVGTASAVFQCRRAFSTETRPKQDHFSMSRAELRAQAAVYI